MANITVSVAYALPEEQVVLELKVEAGATIEKAVLQSGILQKYPEIDLSQNKVGIYGHVEPLSKQLVAKDRVEIYRAITCDPKEVRRQRAKQAKDKKAKKPESSEGSD